MSNTQQGLIQAIKKCKPGYTDHEYERAAKGLEHWEALEASAKPDAEGTAEEREEAMRSKWYDYLKELYEDTGSWQRVFSDFVPEEDYIYAVFVRLVEEKTGKTIGSAKELLDATGIKAYGSFNEGKDEILPYETKPTDKQIQADTEDQIAEIFHRAMEHRYYEALYNLLKNGGKYSDLLAIKPSSFYLPENLREETIKKTLCIYYSLWGEISSRPDIKTVADQIDAPYSVVLSATAG